MKHTAKVCLMLVALITLLAPVVGPVSAQQVPIPKTAAEANSDKVGSGHNPRKTKLYPPNSTNIFCFSAQ